MATIPRLIPQKYKYSVVLPVTPDSRINEIVDYCLINFGKKSKKWGYRVNYYYSLYKPRACFYFTNRLCYTQFLLTWGDSL